MQTKTKHANKKRITYERKKGSEKRPLELHCFANFDYFGPQVIIK